MGLLVPLFLKRITLNLLIYLKVVLVKILRFCSVFDFFGSRSGIKKDTIIIVSCFVK